ncbi:GNAT family N-acetyltransferase [Streptomyces sp. NBC_00249]|uniref:GNAT family N-acetyltransferase n=1 Tax=Streptomyces sp. NBC_00249 TaxID=2975690 RepID=UPI002257A1D9|nr:GNAT family protein [Streptomyces sp. NBC_00249]MCX5192306.1 GNAT family N-acetyltransferase [Streptomyces sp. NBC_00249]
MLHTPRDVLDMEIGMATGVDAGAQWWLGSIADSLVTAETAEYLLGIDDRNRVARLRAFPAAMRRELVQPVVPPEPVRTQWLLAVDPATGRVAGLSSLTPDDDGAIGVRLAPASRGLGLGAELLAGTAQFGHAHLGLECVRAGTEVSNDSCRRALSAAGFVPCDGPVRHTLANGRVTDGAWYRHGTSEISWCASIREAPAMQA